MIFNLLRLKSLGFANRTSKRPARRMIGEWVQPLERRDVPAVIRWDGGAGTLVWSDPANWEGDLLPGTADQVEIGADPAKSENPTPITITAPVVINRLSTDRLVSMSGSNSSLRITSGVSNFNAGLDLNYAGLAVQGSGTVLNIKGAPVQPSQGLILSIDGGTLNWSGVTKMDNMVVMINAGSTIQLPDLTNASNFSEFTVQGGSITAPGLNTLKYSRFSVLDGGKADIAALADASNSLVEVVGIGSQLNLPNLAKFDAGRFRLDQGATVSATSLKTVNIAPATAWSFSWFVGQDSVLNLSHLSSINAVAQPSPNEAPDARILLRKNGRIALDPTVWTTTTGQVSISLAGDSRIDGSLILGSKTIVTGSGTFGGSVDNSGRFSPSGDYSPYGSISVKGDWTSRPGSVMDLQLGGPSKLDRVMVTGQATILGGDLKIQFSDEYNSDPNLIPDGRLQLMTWSVWGGQFTSTPDLVPRTDGILITAQTRYEPTGLIEVLARHRTDPDVFTVSDTTVLRGTNSISYGIFTIRRTGPMTVPITIGYKVIDGTAKSGTNYSFPGGPITLAPGETERQIRFIIRGSSVYIGNKSFQVQLTSASDRGTLGTQTLATVTIKDTVPAPVVKPVATVNTGTSPKIVPASKPKTVVQKPTPKPLAKPKFLAKPKPVVVKK
jgi:hypothetical protein